MAWLQLLRARQEIAPDMAAAKTELEIDRAIENKQPGKQKMPVARERKARIRRQRQPRRKRASQRPAIAVIGDPEHAGRVEVHLGDPCDADGPAVFVFGPD